MPIPISALAGAAVQHTPASYGRRASETHRALRTLGQLCQNPVAFRVGPTGDSAVTITAERLDGGQVRMTCTCQERTKQGWCQHCVDLLCFRFDNIVIAGDAPTSAFRAIVSGTGLQHDARGVQAAAEKFNTSLKSFEGLRPHEVSGVNLHHFTDLVTDLAVTASELEEAIGRLQRRLDRADRAADGASL